MVDVGLQFIPYTVMPAVLEDNFLFTFRSCFKLMFLLNIEFRLIVLYDCY